MEVGRIGVGSGRGRDKLGLGVFRVSLFEEDCAEDSPLFFRIGCSEIVTSGSGVIVSTCSSIGVTELVESTWNGSRASCSVPESTRSFSSASAISSGNGSECFLAASFNILRPCSFGILLLPVGWRLIAGWSVDEDGKVALSSSSDVASRQCVSGSCLVRAAPKLVILILRLIGTRDSETYQIRVRSKIR